MKRAYKKNPLRDFIYKTCRHYDLLLYYLPEPRKGLENKPLWHSSVAHPTLYKIGIAPISGPDQEHAFAAALHEIGHCVDYISSSFEKNNLHIQKTASYWRYGTVNKIFLQDEISAWKIAKSLINNSQLIWTPKMQYVLDLALSHWRIRYNQTHKCQCFIPPL